MVAGVNLGRVWVTPAEATVTLLGLNLDVLSIPIWSKVVLHSCGVAAPNIRRLSVSCISAVVRLLLNGPTPVATVSWVWSLLSSDSAALWTRLAPSFIRTRVLSLMFLGCLDLAWVIRMGALISGVLLRMLLELSTVSAVCLSRCVNGTQLTGLASSMPDTLLSILQMIL